MLILKWLLIAQLGVVLVIFAGCSALPASYVMQSQALCLKSGGSLSQKLVACNQAIRSQRYAGSQLAELYFMRGIHQQEAGKHEAAVFSFNQALKRNPRDSKVYYYLSMSQLRLGHFAAAQHDFDTAHRLN